MAETFGQRLRRLRTEKVISQQSIADMTGVSAVSVSSWERDKSFPNTEALVKLAEILSSSSVDELIGVTNKKSPVFFSRMPIREQNIINKFRMLDESGAEVVTTVLNLELKRVELASLQKPEPVKHIDHSRERYIPKYDNPAAAGTSVPLDGSDFEMILVNEDVPSQADYAVRIQGNSMFPYIKDGDTVYVQKVSELSLGDVGIWCVDGVMYCKQYYLDEDKNLILASANPDYKDTNVFVAADGNHTVTLEGKVLLKHRIDLPDYLFD